MGERDGDQVPDDLSEEGALNITTEYSSYSYLITPNCFINAKLSK